MRIRRKLMELENELAIARSPVLAYFLNGLQREYIISLFQQNSLSPPDELVDLYEWKNGVQFEGVPTGLLHFGVPGVFFPLEDSLKIFHASEVTRSSTYFPVFSDDSFLIQLNNRSPDYGKIFIYSPALQIFEPEACFDSLESMIDTFIVCFRKGAFFYNNDSFFEQDYDKSFDVAKAVNPGSTYWSE
ncbi:hypothetical protein [Dawidia soli]|uniref:Uncharacterized protein n=1 Tax=Dawidia soli TaxID=2782352 RepID=A0AAP2D5D6_9BACT|nr:hypothetical protein [Dawidia soli]MBT1685623.1 hypothetical protein [Dawidia soli]